MITVDNFRPPTWSDKRSLGIAALLLLGAAVAPQARAADSVVGTCNEAGLKAAVSTVVTTGGGTITFTCSGTMTVLGGIINIPASAKVVTIDGTGQSITISGGNKGSIFSVAADFALKNLTLANGFSLGSGQPAALTISSGTTTVSNCTVSGSMTDSTVIANSSSLNVNNSYFTENHIASDNGGAALIANFGELTVEDSYFTGNIDSNESDAMILSTGSTLVANSTFNGNGDSALTILRGSATVINSTFAYSSYGLMTGGSGPITVTNSTFAYNNISNIAGGSSVILQNNIIVGSSSSNCMGSLTDGGGNLRWPTSDSSCVGSYGDPKLGTFLATGGNSTPNGPVPTLPLETGSAALFTAIDALCPPTDERGVIRPQGLHCDIGAYEGDNGISIIKRLVFGFAGFSSKLSPIATAVLQIKILGPLESALNPVFWLGEDGNHLNSQLGGQVFNLEETAANNLNGLIVDQIQLDYIHNVLLSARIITVTAMGDANCLFSGPNVAVQSKCAQANSALFQGDKSAAAGDFGGAIDHYASAWQTVVGP